jgi:hypothetical protein
MTNDGDSMRSTVAKNVLRVFLLTVAALLTTGNTCDRFPPMTPAKPGGPTIVVIGDTAAYTTVTTDPSRRKIRYEFDWGDGATDTTSYFESGDTATSSHTWRSFGRFPVKVWAENERGQGGDFWSDTLNVTVDSFSSPGHPPDAPARPTHTGVDSVLKPIVFSTSATDPDGDSVRIKFFFRQDGEIPTYGPRVASGAVFTDTAVYVTNGWKAIYAVAQDTWGDTSAMSAPDSIFINSPPSNRSPRP